MRAKLVVFPVRGRNWCFSRSIDLSFVDSASTHTPSTFKDLRKQISSSNSSSHNAQLLIDFVSTKMSRAWMGLEKAPEGSMKNKIHGLGLKLLARVKPSEIFLKSISKEVTDVEIICPSSLNPRLVRRRLRHIAMRGAATHKKYFYGSVFLLPLTSAFSVLPLPNIPFFWVLFRTYSHWHALKGSENLLRLVSDCSCTENSVVQDVKGSNTENDDLGLQIHYSQDSLWVLQVSKELEELVQNGHGNDGLSKCSIANICKTFSLNKNDVMKFNHMM